MMLTLGARLSPLAYLLPPCPYCLTSPNCLAKVGPS